MKIDYNNCLTNLSCSILKYFGLDYNHNTLDIIDEYLSYLPKNVVVILCDGMGSNILKRNLSDDDFLVKNMKGSITSVFPTTTAAATTSIMTGLNPVEHCWLGWDNYIKKVDEVITMFLGKIKDTDTVIDKDLCYKVMGYRTIMERINEDTEYYSNYISLFAGDRYETLDEMCQKIKDSCNRKEKNYIYAYYENPDALMHEYGTDNDIVKDNIKLINKTIEKLSEELDDTLLIVVADHGHINCNFIYMEDYDNLFNMLERTTSCDSRACMFFVKEDKKDVFKNEFLKVFKDEFLLLSKEEIINKHIFGDGVEHKEYLNSLGDFIAIGIGNTSIKYKRIEGKTVHKSTHSGITDDEVYVPLIIKRT